MQQPSQVAQRPIYKAVKPERNEAYKRFIRDFPCIVCGGRRWIEAAHFGAHGLSSKASDLDTLPICHRDHQVNPKSYHKLGPVKFARAHRLDIPALIRGFQARWNRRMRTATESAPHGVRATALVCSTKKRLA